MARWLIPRPAEDAARTAAALAARGHEGVSAPVLAIDTADPDPIDLDGVQAVLFTSANGVRAFARLTGARGLPAFAVGAQTAAAAREAGFSDVETAAGDARALEALVAGKLDPAGGALFHGAGRDTAGEATGGDLATRLAAAGFAVRRAVLYRAETVDALPEAAVGALGEGTCRGVLFFSPRTVRVFGRLVEEAGLSDRLASLYALCLSPAAARRLDDRAWAGVRIAERPDLGAMLDLLDAVDPPAAQEQERPRMDSRDQDKPDDPTPEGVAAGDAAAAARVIEAFGGIRPMAAKIGAPVTTVQGWKKRGHIPESRHEDILAAAREHGIDIDASLLAEAAPAEEGPAEEAETGEAAPRPTQASPWGGGATTAEAAVGEPATDAGDDARREAPVEEVQAEWISGAPAAAADEDAAKEAGAGASAEAGTTTGTADGAGHDEPPRRGAETMAAPEPRPMPPVRTGRGIAWLALLIAILGSGAAIGLLYWRPAPVPMPALFGLTERVAALEEAAGGVDPARVATLEDRLAALEDQVATLAEAPAESPADGALADRVAALEDAVAALPEAAPGDATPGDAGTAGEPGAGAEAAEALAELEAQVGELQGAVEALSATETVSPEALDSLSARLDEFAARLDDRLAAMTETVEAARADQTAAEAAQANRIGALAARMDDLARRIDDLDGRVSEVAATTEELSTTDAGAQALVLATGQLRDSLTSGAFVDALTRVRALAEEDPEIAEAVAAIEPYAGTGIPTRAELTARYPTVAREIRAAASADSSGDFVDRTLGALRGVVTIRREDGEITGDDPASVTARAGARLERDDLAGAVEALSALEGAAAVAAEGWMADAEARLSAERTVDVLTLEAIDRLDAAAARAATEDAAAATDTGDAEADAPAAEPGGDAMPA
ncbi:MAG: uroporphyrinogen-III synthase, partial [Azospirillaceae bacterium]